MIEITYLFLQDKGKKYCMENNIFIDIYLFDACKYLLFTIHKNVLRNIYIVLTKFKQAYNNNSLNKGISAGTKPNSSLYDNLQQLTNKSIHHEKIS